MPASHRPKDRLAVVLSCARPFATVILSDFGARRSRERLVVRGEPIPPWLREHVPCVAAGESVVVAARGRAAPGATTCIRSVIVYAARGHLPEQAYVYVEEWDAGARPAGGCAPFHVIRCAELPATVRFVEIPPHAHRRPRGHLRPVPSAEEGPP